MTPKYNGQIFDKYILEDDILELMNASNPIQRLLAPMHLYEKKSQKAI